MIRLLGLVLLAIVVWRLVVRRTAPSSVVTVTRADGRTQRLGADDDVTDSIVAVADRVVP